MLKKIWQSFLRWIRKIFGGDTDKSSLGASQRIDDRRMAAAELPPLDDTDREYLFMQLLEGVAHGWQQPRVMSFFNKIRQRVRKSDWMEWLDRFGINLLATPVPNYELAERMVQLSQLDCGEIGDLAGEYGNQLLERHASEAQIGLLPIMEFDGVANSDHPFGESYGGTVVSDDREFTEIPPERLVDLPAQPPAADEQSQTREITLEEFAEMLHKEPNLVAELAQQFGIETTDPQVIINAVIAQMQQQVQPISGELNVAATPSPPDPLASQQSSPPPAPKLEYKAEDPWRDDLSKGSAEQLSETVNSPDRGD